MNKEFLMGSSDFITRNKRTSVSETLVSEDLHLELMKICLKEGFTFYEEFFSKDSAESDPDKLIANYVNDLKEARSFNLFKVGGVREKDHLNFWCLGKVLSTQLYVESGVFIGSSLHAFSKATTINKIIAIDPNLNKLRIPRKNLPTAEFIDKQDFSQIQFADIPDNSLVYFDDHINTANRIIQAKQKGFKYLLFDDSTGLEGICQRLYPATPTIPMIVNWDILSPGQLIEWTWSSPPGLKNWIKRIARFSPGNTNARVQLKVEESMIQQCKEANRLIKRCSKIPDFGEYLPQVQPTRTIDTTKYIVELVD